MSYCVPLVKNLRALGSKKANEIMRRLSPLLIVRVHSHDTGCQCQIYGNGVLLWRGSVWYDSRYEFNDSDHYPGIQPDCEFASLVIGKFFDEVASELAREEEKNKLRKSELSNKQEVERALALQLLRGELENPNA